MSTTAIDYDRLAAAVVDEMEDRGLVAGGSSAQKEKGLVPLQELAEEEGVAPSTIYRRYLYGTEIPRRTAEGFEKESKGRTTYISRAELEVGERLDTRIVRREAGLIE